MPGMHLAKQPGMHLAKQPGMRLAKQQGSLTRPTYCYLRIDKR